jgi:methionyl-tRNA synthetase
MLTRIAPTDITDTFGVDAFRYYFMSAISFGQDGSFSWEDQAARYQSELANGFGNLASRVIAMVNKYYDGVVPEPGAYSEADLGIQRTVADAVVNADAAMQKLAIHDALAAIWTIVDELNGYITIQEPWVLAKSDETRERLGTVLYTTADGLRALAVLLSPVIPDATAKLWEALGQASSVQEQSIPDAGGWGQLQPGTRLGTLAALFPRIEQAEAAG